jgi:hypothetical protein|tara:strand:+ start:1464 stop:1682 length:219 start_codon:yes stop_codon:yes gene_type:complete
MSEYDKKDLWTDAAKINPFVSLTLVPVYKYKVDFKHLNIVVQFVDMTWGQRIFARWFLSGTITKSKENNNGN